MLQVCFDLGVALSAQTQTPSYSNHVFHVKKAESWTEEYGTNKTKSATDYVYLAGTCSVHKV